MSNGVQATMVVLGLFVLCGIPVIGPVLSDVGDSAVRTVLGVDEETAVENRKVRTMKSYQGQGELRKANECCVKCNLDWDFIGDRCTLATQRDTSCYMKCAQ